MPKQDAMTITIPKDFELSGEEIRLLLTTYAQRKASGDIGITVQGDIPDGITITLPLGFQPALTPLEMGTALERLNEAKAYGNADVLFTFDQGQMVKKGWLTKKDRPGRDFRVGGEPLKLQW